MAKKINDTPRDPETFLDSYKPVSPNLKPKTSSLSEMNTVAEDELTSAKMQRKQAICGDSPEREYENRYLSKIMSIKKINRVYVCDNHFDKIQSVVKSLGSRHEGLNIGSFIWNILEEHFRLYGGVLHNLIEENPRHNPFDDCK